MTRDRRQQEKKAPCPPANEQHYSNGRLCCQRAVPRSVGAPLSKAAAPDAHWLFSRVAPSLGRLQKSVRESKTWENEGGEKDSPPSLVWVLRKRFAATLGEKKKSIAQSLVLT